MSLMNSFTFVIHLCPPWIKMAFLLFTISYYRPCVFLMKGEGGTSIETRDTQKRLNVQSLQHVHFQY